MNNKQLLEQILIAEDWAIMIKNAVPLLKSLKCLQEEHPLYAGQISDIHDGIREGSSIYALMDQKRFHPFLREMICQGERYGTLDTSLIDASKALKKELWAITKIPCYGENIVFYSQLSPMVECLSKSEEKRIWTGALDVIKKSDYLPKKWKNMAGSILSEISYLKDDSTTEKVINSMIKYEKLFDAIDRKMIGLINIVPLNELELLSDYYETLFAYKYTEEGNKIIFYKQLAMLLGQGVNIKDSLDTIKFSAHLSKDWKKLAESLSDYTFFEDKELSEAMSRYKVFKKSEIEIIESGISGGIVDETINELAEHYKSICDYRK